MFWKTTCQVGRHNLPKLMNDEDALLAIASPISWQWHPGSRETSYWEGRDGNTRYVLVAPRSAGDVDTLPSEQSWCLYIADIFKYYTPVDTVADGKVLCQQHAISGDLSALQTRYDVSQARDEAYKKAERIAFDVLKEPFYDVSRTPLAWEPDERYARQKSAVGSRGTYTVRFNPKLRWTAMRIEAGKVVDEYRFLTRSLAIMACSVYDFIEQWRGML